MVCVVPQGSVLGAILFLLYFGDLQLIIESHRLCPHLYADDSQIYDSCRPSAYLELQSRISTCIDHVAEWMRSNRLQLNAAKYEILWSAVGRRLHQLPQTRLRVDTDFVTPSSAVWDLGIHLYSDMSMSSHVRKTVSTCFAVLRQLRSIRRSVSRPVVQSLVTSLVLSRLNYGNATLAGIPQHLRWLQSVMNAAARLIYSSSKFDYITPLLHQLHWLKAKEQLAVLVFKCVHGPAPPCLADELSRPPDSLAWCKLRLASSSILVVCWTRLTVMSDQSFPVAVTRVWTILHSTSSRHLPFESSKTLENSFICFFLSLACKVTFVILDTLIVSNIYIYISQCVIFMTTVSNSF